jgi:hypothetical protein
MSEKIKEVVANLTLGLRRKSAANIDSTAGARAMDRADLLTPVKIPSRESIVKKKAMEKKKSFSKMLATKSLSRATGAKFNLGVCGAIFSPGELPVQTKKGT